MKLTKKQIDMIIENTPEELKGRQDLHFDGEDLGRYMKPGANWSYRAGFITHNGVKVLVVKVHGQVQ